MENNHQSLPRTIMHLWNRWKSASVEIMHIEAQKAFLRTVQSVRLVLMALVAAWFFFGMLMFVVGVIHVAVYFAFPAGQKMTAVLSLLGLDVVVACILGYFLFSEKKWLEYSRTYRMLHENEQNSSHHEEPGYQTSERRS